MIPPPSKLPDLIDAHIHATFGIINEGVKDFLPKLLVELWDFETQQIEMNLIALVIDMDSYQEKRKAMENLGRNYYGSMKIPVGIALATEAWISSEAGGMKKKPSECDDRKEVLLISAMAIDRTTELHMMPIERDRNGNIKPGGSFVKDDRGVAEMPLLGAFFQGFANAFFEKEKGRR